MALQLKFGTLDLSDIAEWREESPSRVPETVFPRRTGSIAPVNPPADSRRIRLVGEAVHSDEAMLKSYLQDLGYELSQAGRQALQLRDDERYYKAVKESYGFGFSYNNTPGTTAQINIGFLADDPHLYAPLISEQTDAVAGVSWTFALTNNGKARTPPVLELLRSAGTDVSDVLITHTATGHFFKVTGTLAVGTKLIFDFVNRRVVQAGENALDRFTGLIAFDLRPGVNTFLYQGPGNVSIYSTWHERWL